LKLLLRRMEILYVVELDGGEARMLEMFWMFVGGGIGVVVWCGRGGGATSIGGRR
jgi:hypothetical protein